MPTGRCHCVRSPARKSTSDKVGERKKVGEKKKVRNKESVRLASKTY